MTNAQTEYMTVTQVAELFDKDDKTIRNWINLGKDGPFPGAFKVSGGSKMPWMIPTAEVAALQKERDQAAT
jgi:hypothetical protein